MSVDVDIGADYAVLVLMGMSSFLGDCDRKKMTPASLPVPTVTYVDAILSLFSL